MMCPMLCVSITLCYAGAKIVDSVVLRYPKAVTHFSPGSYQGEQSHCINGRLIWLLLIAFTSLLLDQGQDCWNGHWLLMLQTWSHLLLPFTSHLLLPFSHLLLPFICCCRCKPDHICCCRSSAEPACTLASGVQDGPSIQTDKVSTC